MKNERIFKFGFWQTLYVGEGLEKRLSGLDGISCWATTDIPRKKLREEPVDVLVAYHGNKELTAFLQNGVPNHPRIVVTASSLLRFEEAVSLRELGVESFLYLPRDEAEEINFLKALKAIAGGKSLVDFNIMTKATADQLRAWKAPRIIDTPLSKISVISPQYAMI